MQILHAQDRPKIGLVLSGGGAKGMAHIGILKKLEELGIRPDYITGTSMGSVIGGLYASGYSASEIEEIALGMNWDEILSNKIPMDRINFQEKAYYERYMLELGINKFKLELPKGLIEGQRLTEVLSYLTRHVHDVDDFSQLPIPFACVAADISTGEPVVLDHGSLALSIRASMAIPSVFTPVELDDRLLVDGGLVRNFPVPECKAMGADFIIGVFVSDDLNPKEDLKSAVDVLSQSAFVMSVFDSRKQKEACDLLISPDLSEYSTFSFDDPAGIIEQGNLAADRFEPQLRALVDSIGSRQNELFTRPALRDSFFIKNIAIVNDSELPEKFIKRRLNIEENELVSIEEVENRMDILFGTRYFTKVWYELTRHSEGYDLTVYVTSAVSAEMKFALHFDSENSVGLNVNFTKRNLIPGLRVLLEADISENPRVDLNFLKYLGEGHDWALKTGIFYRNSDVPILNDASVLEATYRNRYFNPYIGFWRATGINSNIGVNFMHQFSRLKPQVASTEIRTLENIIWDSWSANLFYQRNTLNHRYFPTKGSTLSSNLKLSFGNNYRITFTDSLSSEMIEVKPETFASLELKHHHRILLSPKLTLGIRDALVFNFIDRGNTEAGQLPFFNDAIFIGGNRPLLHNAIEFWGAKPQEFYSDFMFYNEILLQYEVIRKIYFELASQYVNVEYPMKWFYSGTEDGEFYLPEDRTGLWGYGARISYNSVIGPVTFGIASRQGTSKWNGFFSVGFYF